jgi:uncharacterized hydrophobic protein (TIGR00271 family)
MGDSEQGSGEIAELFLVHDGTFDLQMLSDLDPVRSIIELPWEQRNTPPAGTRVLLYVGDELIREIVPLAIEKQWELGLLPHPDATQANRALGVKGDVKSLISHYFEAQTINADVLTCNDQVVLSSVAIGEVLSLRPYDINRPPTRYSAFLGALKALKNLRLRSYSLTTGKEQKIQLAAYGMVVMEQTQSTLMGRAFSEALSISDGRLTLLALAPRSILSYLWFLVRLLFPKKISLSRLPGAVGLIRSNRILIEEPEGIDYLLDGTPVTAKTIDLAVLDERISLLPGPSLIFREDKTQSRDSIKLGYLPINETAEQLAGAPLPFFSHASEEEYRDLFVSLRDNAKTSSPYLVLTILSVLLALAGLYANSAPVIIGAMILAPLMAPIISLAMGLARTELSLIRNSVRTLSVGIAAGLSCAIFVAWMMPFEHLTNEMQARLSPTLLDLSIAVISGIAGAYAHAKEDIAKSLAGVAIAVALVPPLSVAGIGLGWGDWVMAKGALLLFITNLFGISLAASVTFLVLGFAPFHLARKGLAISLILLAVIVWPLYVAFDDLVDQEEILNEIPVGQIELKGQAVDLNILEVRMGKPPLVRVVLSSSQKLNEDHVDALKQMIGERIGGPLLLEAQLNLRR